MVKIGRVACSSGIAAIVALVLVGCTAHGIPSASTTTSEYRSTPTTAPASAGPALHGVIATGTLSSPDGATSGAVILTAAHGTVTATLKNFKTAASGQIDLVLTTAATTAPCPDDDYGVVMNSVNGQTDVWSLPIELSGSPFESNPTDLRTLVLRSDAATTPNPNNCIYPPLAVAALRWDIAP